MLDKTSYQKNSANKSAGGRARVDLNTVTLIHMLTSHYISYVIIQW